MNQDPKLAYREAAVRSASSVDLVIMLYDVLIEDLRRAIVAVKAHDIEARTFEIKHALNVVQQLQGSLQMERGGEAARNLDNFYAIARAKLLEAQLKCSEPMLQEQIHLFAELRDAWRSVATAANAGADPQPQIAPPMLPDYQVAEHSGAHWSA